MTYDLVFEGGGAKGMVFVGALQAFEERGHTFGRLLGTSAGAITATLLAAGYTSAEMLAALAEKCEDDCSVFTTFMSTPAPFKKKEIQASATREFLRRIDIPWLPNGFENRLDDVLAGAIDLVPGLRHLFSFIERGGWYTADHFIKWLEQKLDINPCTGESRQFSKLTLAQFYDATQVELSLVATDITANQMLVLNHHTAPDVPVVWAVRMSMSIPFLWEEVRWKAEWGHYRGRERTGNAIVDGGVLSNFPLELLVSNDAPVMNVMGPSAGDSVLGLLIDETLPVNGADPESDNHNAGKDDELQTIQRLKNLLNTMMRARDKMVIEDFGELVVRLPAKGYKTTQFNLSDHDRDLLVQAGRNAMNAYLDKHPVRTRAMKSRAAFERMEQTANQLARRMLGAV